MVQYRLGKKWFLLQNTFIYFGLKTEAIQFWKSLLSTKKDTNDDFQLSLDYQ